MKKIAVILSGCGFQDGTEITEAISLLIALDQQEAKVQIFAPDIESTETDHRTGRDTGSKRFVLAEAQRIARSQAQALSALKVADFDGVALPGGFGAAKVLCNWAQKGSQATVLPELEKVLRSFHEAGKPIAAMCIAPVLLARVFGKLGPSLTIGDDKETAQEIEKTGAHHVTCPVNDYVTDREHKMISTPAYMYDARPAEVFRGISGLAKELVEMA